MNTRRHAAVVRLDNRRTTRRRDWRTALTFFGFVGPLLLGLVVFIVVPIVWGLLISLNDARGNVDLSRWVGLRNYLDLLRDRDFLESLRTVTLFTLLIVPLTYALSLGLALLVNAAGRGQAFFRSVFFLPTACSFVVGALVWRLGLFSGVPYSLGNKALLALGLQPINWTFEQPWVWVVLITLRLWIQLGFNMLIFLAGLTDIPRSLYEAATIDGANGLAAFRSITLPLLRNTSIFIVFTNVIGAFQAFDEFFNVLATYGGSSSAAAALGARPPLWYLLDLGFKNLDFGRATAGAFIVALLIMIAAVAQIRLFGLGRSNY